MAAKSVDDYIAATSGPVRETLEAARQMVRRLVSDASEAMKYGAPTFLTPRGKPQIYLYGGRDHVNVGFYHGVLLEDPDGLLRGTGKEGRHMRFGSPDELADERVAKLIVAAMALDIDPE